MGGRNEKRVVQRGEGEIRTITPQYHQDSSFSRLNYEHGYCKPPNLTSCMRERETIEVGKEGGGEMHEGKKKNVRREIETSKTTMRMREKGT